MARRRVRTTKTGLTIPEAGRRMFPAVWQAEDLRIALEESVKLQSHYAELLNLHDGGQRLGFKDADAWIARLRETGTLPKPMGSLMAKTHAKAHLTISLLLTPGICRWCRCTYDNPCANGCSWVDRAQTLCSECETLDTAMQTAKGRQALAVHLQESADLALLQMPDDARPGKARARR